MRFNRPYSLAARWFFFNGNAQMRCVNGVTAVNPITWMTAGFAVMTLLRRYRCRFSTKQFYFHWKRARIGEVTSWVLFHIKPLIYFSTYLVSYDRYFQSKCNETIIQNSEWGLNMQKFSWTYQKKQCSLGVSHKFYSFATISTSIDADFQCQQTGFIFIENG